jgi:hypothetical protein
VILSTSEQQRKQQKTEPHIFIYQLPNSCQANTNPKTLIPTPTKINLKSVDNLLPTCYLAVIYTPSQQLLAFFTDQGIDSIY